MFCPRCGNQTAQGAAFCENCGRALLSDFQPDYSPQSYQAQLHYGLQPQPRRRIGLVIGLISAAVVFAASVIIALILLTAGNPITGLWYSIERAQVIEFKDSNACIIYTPGLRQKGKYTYDKAKGKGVLNFGGTDYTFTAGKSDIKIKDLGEYMRADEGFDMGEFFDEFALSPTPAPVPSPEPSPEPSNMAKTVINENMTLSLAFGQISGNYTGETVEGLPDGYGIFTSADYENGGWMYEGDWVSGHMCGDGFTSWGSGYYQAGVYSDDYLNGQGSEYWSDTLYYEGFFTNGLFHGQGTIYNIHGEIIYSGDWAYGFIKEPPGERSARVGAFKEECVCVTREQLYESCEKGESTRVKIEGVVFDVFQYDGQEYYCDFLMYFEGVEDKGKIIQVYYQLSEGESRVSNGQKVTVWGTGEHLYSYLAGNNEYLTVPLVEAWSVE